MTEGTAEIGIRHDRDESGSPSPQSEFVGASSEIAPDNVLKPAGWMLHSICLLMSAHFAVAYNTMTIPMVPFGPYKELTGRGGPFAYRMLPAILWQVCSWALAPLHSRFPRLHLPIINKPFDSNEGWFMTTLTFFAMLGTLLVARRLLRSIDRRWGFEWLALGVGLAAYFDTILVLNRNLFYPYDVTALFFFTLLVYLAFRDRPLALAATLMIAMLNKETAIMAVPIYFGLQFKWNSWRRTTIISCVMLVAAVIVRVAAVTFIHHRCPFCGEMSQNQLAENLHQLTNPLFWLSELSVFGFAYFAAILFWQYVPRQVRITALFTYALWAAGMVVVGILREVRIFSELSALLLLVVALGVHGWLETNQRSTIPGGDSKNSAPPVG